MRLFFRKVVNGSPFGSALEFLGSFDSLVNYLQSEFPFSESLFYQIEDYYGEVLCYVFKEGVKNA